MNLQQMHEYERSREREREEYSRHRQAERDEYCRNRQMEREHRQHIHRLNLIMVAAISLIVSNVICVVTFKAMKPKTPIAVAPEGNQ